MKIRTFLIGLVCCMAVSGAYAYEQSWNIAEKRSLAPGAETERVIEVSASTTLTDACIEITDLSGEMVYRETVTIPAGCVFPIYINNFPQGSYLFTLTQGEKSMTLEFDR